MGSVHNRGTNERPRWYCNYIDLDGRRKQRRLRAVTREEAAAELLRIETRITGGEPGQPPHTRSRRPEGGSPGTLRSLVGLFMTHAVLRSKDPVRYRAALGWLLSRHVLPTLGELPLASLGPGPFEDLCESLLGAGYKVRTINAVLRACSILFSFARRRGLVSGPNPVSGLQRRAPEQEAVYLSEDDTARLLAEAERRSRFLWTILRTALFTGLRKGELFGLRWSDVDLVRGVLFVRRSFRLCPKSGKSRAVPLHPELGATLQVHRATTGDSELVFPVRGKMAHRHELLDLPEVLRSVGVQAGPRPFHALRHTFASHFMMSGGNPLALQRILGHSRFEMTQIYSHLAPGFLSQEILRIPFAGKPRPE